MKGPNQVRSSALLCWRCLMITLFSTCCTALPAPVKKFSSGPRDLLPATDHANTIITPVSTAASVENTRNVFAFI